MEKLAPILLLVSLLSVSSSDALAAKLIEPKSLGEVKKSSERKRDLWVVSQLSDSVNQQSVCVSKSVFKFVLGDISVIAKAPDWRCNVLNERAKVYCEVPLMELRGLKGVRSLGVKKWKDIETKKDQSLCGQEILCFEGAPEGKESKATKVVLCTTAKVPIDAGALHVLERIYATEGLKGVPLTIQFIQSGLEKPDDRLSTKWCLNRNLKEHIFAIPDYFTKVDKIADVETTTMVKSNRDRRIMVRSSRSPKKPRPGSNQAPAK